MDSWRETVFRCVRANVTERTRLVGIGTGRTVPVVLSVLRDVATEMETFASILCFASSFETARAIQEHGFRLGSSVAEELDVVFDGADAVDSSLNCIKGGGYAFVEEKRLAVQSRKTVVIVGKEKTDDGALWGYLGETKKEIRVAVLRSSAWLVEKEMKRVLALGGRGCTCSVVLKRSTETNAFPFVSENGFFVLGWNPFVCGVHDLFFRESLGRGVWSDVSQKIKGITGVVEHGLFCGVVTECCVAGTEKQRQC
ncbi:MAG: ribose-5-phosphate isomerase [Amphiamblys sp. WSBS2006]|nr:MAG: ribose-5-phosphate isomerase [Amphiamblys sp. WSBS2006]